MAHRALVTVAFVACASISAATPVMAQSQITLSLSGSKDSPTLVGDQLNGGTISFDKSRGVSVVVSCPESWDCTTMGSTPDQDAKKNIIATTSTKAYTVTVPQGMPATTFAVALTYGGKPVSPALSFSATGSPPPPVPAAVPLKLRVRNKSCTTKLPTFEADAYVLWLDGTPIMRPTHVPNENSKLVFYIWGDASLVRTNTAVTRKSPIRTITISNIVGANVETGNVPQTLTRQGAIECTSLRVELTEFAPLTGQVEIDVVGDNGTDDEKNTFEFSVATLYTGAFELGGIYTRSGSPTFGKVFNGADTVATVTHDAGRRLLYVMTYTPFVWGRRDVTQPLPREEWYKALNPMAGVVLNDIPNNGIVGLSYSFSPMFSLMAGVHGANVDQLDPNANAVLGKPFANRGATVPTVRRWIFNSFYGGSIDLSAAVGLLKAAVGTAAGTGTPAKP